MFLKNQYIAIEPLSSTALIAICEKKKQWNILSLEEIPKESLKAYVKQLDIQTTTISIIDGKDSVLRSFTLPLKRGLEFNKLIHYQIEASLPIDPSKVVIRYEYKKEKKNFYQIFFTAVNKTSIENNSKKYDSYIQITKQHALLAFVKNSVKEKFVLVIHKEIDGYIVLAIDHGVILENYQATSNEEALRSFLALCEMFKKQLEKQKDKGVLFTGHNQTQNFKEIIEKSSPLQTISCENRRFAAVIGACYAETKPNFAKNPFSIENSFFFSLLKRVALLLFILFSLLFLIEEKTRKQNEIVTEKKYLDLIRKAKVDENNYPFSKAFAGIEKVESQLSLENIALKPKVATPNQFLDWFNQLKVVQNHKGAIITEEFRYTLLDWPKKKRKNAKYRAKVSMTLQIENSHIARELNETLNQAKEIIDLKKEILWSKRNGLFETSFYLKDKKSSPIH